MSESRSSAASSGTQSGGAGSGNSSKGSGQGGNSESAKQAGTGADGVAELAKQGQEAVSQAQDQAVKLVGMAREQATTQVATQKERAAGVLGALGTALQDASRQVREHDDAAMADYIEMAAGQIDGLATMVKEQDLGQLIESAQQFARRQPMVFVAAAIAVGFIGTRFIRSSSPSPGGQNGSGSSWSSDHSNRSGTSAEFGDRSSGTGSTEYGAPMASSGRGAGRQ